ncbi:hypothetical protein C2S52_012640 [Perilla frutescens var. hirtella]|nr:hypothetical protein C2S52_012640 [Perilla frutescens var. hirtella]
MSIDVKDVSELEHVNKENIPPLSLSNKPGPNNKKAKCTLVKINEARKPLRDISHLYKAANRAHLRGFRPPSSISVCGLTSKRKRKLEDDGAEQEQQSCSKILRKEYR